MKKGTAILTLSLLLASPASAESLEETLSKPLPLWERAASQLMLQGAQELKGAKELYLPPGAVMTEIFGELTENAKTAREVQELYRRAVETAARDALTYAARECRLQDADVALPAGDAADEVRLECGKKMEDFVKERAPEYLREVFKKCSLLSLNPSTRPIVGCPGCSWFARYLPGHAVDLAVKQVGKVERELSQNPRKAKFEELRRVYGALKNSQLPF